MSYRKNKGFSLIELMVAVVIVGILAAVAIPNYQEYVKRGARTAGQNYLADLAQRQELRFQNARSYSDTVSGLGAVLPKDLENRYAEAVITKVDPAAGTLGAFSITLSPLSTGLLAGDGDLVINSDGLRYRGTSTSNVGWDK